MLQSLRARFTFGLAALALTLAIVSTVTIFYVGRLGGAIETILRENLASVVACEDMLESLERQDAAVQLALSTGDTMIGPMLARQRAAFSLAFAREARNITVPGEDARVREIEGAQRAYVAAVDRALAAPVATEREVHVREMQARSSVMRRAIQQVRRMNQSTIEQADHNAKAVARRAMRIALGVVVAAVVFAVWFAWWLPRAIIRPVNRLTEIARAVGEGDLDLPIGPPEVLELAPLAEAFASMTAKLRAYRASSLGELLAARDLAHATMACLIDPVAVFGRDGEIVLTNEAAERSFGLRIGSPAELRAANVRVPEEFAIACASVFASGGAVRPKNLSEAMRWQTAEGERFYLVRAAPLRSESAEQPRAIIVAQEVTRFRRIDELKSDMVATVSHEFKTPLTSLRMATHLLLEPGSGPLNGVQRELVSTARTDTERLRTMVDELLDLVRIESEAGALHVAPVDLLALLREVAEAHRTIATQRGVSIAIAPGGEVGPVPVDREKLSIVLANLISNAIRHTPSGGRIELRVRRDGAVTSIAVSDTGEGISPESLTGLLAGPAAHVSHDNQSDRHGLGLSIAREIVLQHGGDLQAQSTRGTGTTFTVVLPSA